MPNPIRKPCIYCITNLQTSNRYVGSTANFVNRRNQHKYGLRHNNHYSLLMQKDYEDFGEDSFKFFILEEVETFDRLYLFEREQFWMDKYKPEYNNNPKAGDCFLESMYQDPNWKLGIVNRHKGRKQSQEEKDKRAKSIHNHWEDEHTKGNKKVISDEQKDKLRQSNLGENNPNWGTHFSSERSKNHSDGLSYMEYTFIAPDGELVVFCNLMNPRTDRADLPNYVALKNIMSGQKHKGWKFMSKRKIK